MQTVMLEAVALFKPDAHFLLGRKAERSIGLRVKNAPVIFTNALNFWVRIASKQVNQLLPKLINALTQITAACCV